MLSYDGVNKVKTILIIQSYSNLCLSGQTEIPKVSSYLTNLICLYCESVVRHWPYRGQS